MDPTKTLRQLPRPLPPHTFLMYGQLPLFFYIHFAGK